MRIANQQLIKDSNMKLLYSIVHQNRGISRTQLARMTRLSKTTVSTLVDELICRNFILDTGSSESENIGRRPNNLIIRPQSYYVIVLNWIVDIIFVSVVDIAGNSVYNKSCQLSPEETYLTLSRKCVDQLLDTRFSRECILGICVSVSAMIDAVHEEIYSTTLSLKKSDDINLIRELRHLFPAFPVAILEDTACYAYAEKVYTHIEEDNFAFINFGRGIGATIFINGMMLGNASGAVTQFGHYSPDFSGELCACGNRGCLETILSEHSIKRQLKTFGSSLLDLQEHITFSDLNKAALFGDYASLQLLSFMAEILAKATANLICIVNPDLIILGGSAPALGPIFLTEFRRFLSEYGFNKMVSSTSSRYSQLDSDACKNGAMKYFFDQHFSFAQNNAGAFWIG
ncbi:MAG: ROK family transcriptional regulator [Lachnospiraceae bacterium]|nr:ROK family transcriptional regulator [Lachnospiraceae bacterium]